LSSYGEDWRIYEHLGDVEQALNNDEEFIENYEKSFEIFAGNEDVAEALAEYYSNSNPSRVIEICLKFKKEKELSLSLF
jgi:tetratricopeptide (TPR) repeat protein